MSPNPSRTRISPQLGQRYRDDAGNVWTCVAIRDHGGELVGELVRVVGGDEWAVFVPLGRLRP